MAVEFNLGYLSPMLKTINRSTVWLLAVLILGCGLRFVGLTRGDSDFVLPEQVQDGSGKVDPLVKSPGKKYRRLTNYSIFGGTGAVGYRSPFTMD